MAKGMAAIVTSAIVASIVTAFCLRGGEPAQAQAPPPKAPGASQSSIEALYYSVARPPKGDPIVLTNSVLFRVPQLSDSGWTEHYNQLHEWLAREYGGWARWPVEIDAGRNAAGVSYYFYMVSMGADNDPRLAEQVDAKLRTLFPDFPVYVVSLPHMPILVNATQ